MRKCITIGTPRSRLQTPSLLAGVFLLVATPGCKTGAGADAPPDAAAALPANPALPDPLVALNGQRIASPRQWDRERRPELLRLFQQYVYGKIPPRPKEFHARQTGEYHDFLGGRATLKLLTLECGPGNGPKIDLMLVLPNARKEPSPVLLAMNFCGNQALTSDPRVPLARGWLFRNCPGCADNHATEASRGAQAVDWPLDRIVERGYALAAFASSDVDADRGEASDGIYAWLANGDPARNNPTNRGTIAAWAWGFHRCVDYLVTDPQVDTKRIAVVGHSRNGKTALLAAAFDERIALAFPHQAGCGGTAPSRGKVGESVKAINDRFPHWFNATFKQFNECPEKLPLDQNCLMALCAPRALLISAAQEDQWANPVGQFENARSADAVYRLFNTPGLGVVELPALGRLTGQRLGYYIRAGKHSMTAADWGVFMDFADRQWRR